MIERAIFGSMAVPPTELNSRDRNPPEDFKSNVLSYDVVIRNWTPYYLQVNPFALTDGTNPEWVEFLHAVIPYGETDSICYGTLPDLTRKKMNWLFGTEPFTLEDGKSSIPISRLPSQAISLHMPPLIKDQPWMLDGLVFNFSETDVRVSYQLRIRGKILEFLPSGQPWDGEKQLRNHSPDSTSATLAMPKDIQVENPFLLRGKDRSYGMSILNATEEVLNVHNFPPEKDSTLNPLLFETVRWTIWGKTESCNDSIEMNWEILDWQDGGARTTTIRSGKQTVPLTNFDQIRRENELYTINFVWNGSLFQLTYTVVRDGTLVDILPDGSIAPKSIMASRQKISGYHERE